MRAFDAQCELTRGGFHTRLDLDMLHGKGANEEGGIETGRLIARTRGMTRH
jgi:hypothetical protein